MRHVYIKPQTPQLNGKVECSHRTDQTEFYQLLTNTDDVDLNAKLKPWENFYNYDRPHLALAGKTPYEVQQNQMSLFEWADTSEDDWMLQQKVDAQLEILGVSVMAHPLELISDKLAGSGAITTVDAITKTARRVTVAAVQQASHRTRIAHGDMLFLSIEDLQGTLDAILFPEVYRQAKSMISSTKPFLLTGVMELDTERGEPFLRVETVVPVK